MTVIINTILIYLSFFLSQQLYDFPLYIAQTLIQFSINSVMDGSKSKPHFEESSLIEYLFIGLYVLLLLLLSYIRFIKD